MPRVLGVELPPDRPSQVGLPPRSPMPSAPGPTPEQHRAASLEVGAVGVRVPLLGVAALVTALAGAGAVFTRSDLISRLERIEARQADTQANQAKEAECRRRIVQFLIAWSETQKRQSEIMGALVCKLGAKARGMSCTAVEFDTPPLCPRGQNCSPVWHADVEWPSTPEFRGCD